MHSTGTAIRRRVFVGWILAAMLAGHCAACLSLAAVLKGAKKDARLAPPTFSVPGGMFTNGVVVELKAGTATVRFTTDGSEPTSSSSVYRTSLRITNCTLVRARAWYEAGTVSSTVSQSYLVLADDLLGFNSNLPLVFINTSDGEIESTGKSLAAARIVTSSTGRNTPFSPPDFDGLALLNVRGFSSLRYPKHSYSMKVVNELCDARNVSLLKLPKESDWVLYGPYPDKTLMRDALAYELSNDMGRWAPHTRFVEVFVNESPGRLSMDDYVGVYLLVEKVTRDKNRVNVTRLELADNREPEVSGGYIFKKDHVARSARRNFGEEGPPQASRFINQSGFPTPPGGFPADPAGFLPSYESRLGTGPATLRTPRLRKTRPGFAEPVRPKTNYVASVVLQAVRLGDETLFPGEEGFRTMLQGNQFYFHEPEPDEITTVQRAWLKDYVNRFESALHGTDFTDRATGYRAFIDADSFIDHHLLVEVTKNVDGFRFSTFYHKDRAGLLQMGPAWDWNLSFGNADGKQGYMPEYWLWPQLDDQQYSWFRRLFEDPDFGQRYVDRWGQLRTNVFATSNILARVDAMAKLLAPAQQRNFAKWEILGRDVTPNYFVGDDYTEEVNWMKQWIEKRLAWIERQFLPAPTVLRGKTISLTTTVPDGKIFYTLDGSDPRAPGGSVATSARTFQSPLNPPATTKLMARVQNGTRWSPPVLLP